MTTVNIYDIKARFSYYAKKVMSGDSFIIAMRNKPFAVLKPLEILSSNTKIKFGVLKGKFSVPNDFNKPLERFEKDYYGE